ncbi:zinc finger BED domain-containing protein 4-like [Wyeomyia smithii]|uniref:zinc finger BED domain-containing protein 4-like n=1 Tax=Wyeomyia smithii TaxID=174621 RepID=UPI00246800C4|nr:zinc finger BED domain-containing protein 4-like [Wyeomyia smithii]
MRTLAPSFKIPSVSYIKEKLCLKYEVLSASYKLRINRAPHICLSMDIWTETMSEKGFLGITVHFLEGTSFVSTDIVIKQMCTNHTADNIKKAVIEALNEWDIDHTKVVSVVTDNGVNMVAAMRKTFENRRLPCFAHTLNLVTETTTSLDVIKVTISKVRGIVCYVKNSVNVSDRFRMIQSNNNVSEGNTKKLILDVKTRWNSTYYMIERFLEMRKVLIELLIDDTASPSMPSSAEVEILRQLVTLLRPFEFLTKELSGDKYVTLSKIIPMINCLFLQISSFKCDVSEILSVKECFLKELKKRFGQIEQMSQVAIATILDPGFKNIHFQDPTACAKALSKIRSTISKNEANAVECRNLDSNTHELCEQQQKNTYNFWKHHKLLMFENPKKQTNAGDELALYLTLPVSSLDSNPLEQWEDMRTVFPELYQQARMYLVNMATSVPCERLFSKTGSIMTKKRNRLSAKYLQKLVFLGSLNENEWFE